MEYFLTALIPLAAIACVVILAKRIAAHSFRCRHCSEVFQIPWRKVLVTEHSGRQYALVCPCCKTKDWCEMQPEPFDHRQKN